MTDLTILQHWKAIITKLFPWLARFGLAPSGALRIASPVGRIEIEGGGPAVARVGDALDGGGLAFYPGVPSSVPPSLWYTASQSEPYIWVPVAMTIAAGPLPLASGTRIVGVITSGSAKVQCG